jgi:hypothetical protein
LRLRKPIAFSPGRQPAPVEAVAEDIVSAGGSAEAAQVDAIDIDERPWTSIYSP